MRDGADGEHVPIPIRSIVLSSGVRSSYSESSANSTSATSTSSMVVLLVGVVQNPEARGEMEAICGTVMGPFKPRKERLREGRETSLWSAELLINRGCAGLRSVDCQIQAQQAT